MSGASPQLISLDAPTLVEASAGTGKTYAITTFFVRAILEDGLDPEQILVVTYTKAATAELRARARDRIVEALKLLDAGPEDGDVLVGVVAAAVERLGRSKTEARLRKALGEMDRAAILTIHGFCQRLLQDYPLLFGVDFDFEVVENSSSMHSELAVDFWTSELYDAPDWLLRVLEEEKVTPDQLAKLSNVAGMPGVQLLGPEPHEVDDAAVGQWLEIRREAGVLWKAERGNILGILLEDKRLDGRQYQKRVVTQRWPLELDDFFDKTGFHQPPAFLDRLAQGRLRTKRDAEEPTHPFFEACARFWSVHESLAAGLRYAVFSFRSQFVEYVEAQSRRRREERAVFTFDDLLSSVYAPFDVRSEQVRKFDAAKIAQTIVEAYPLALVDEFQDTDSIQYGIFRAIYGESSAVYVGDPKQAIYGFRGADVFSYLGAASDVGERRHTLSTNWRSDQGLVNAVNTLFSLRAPPFVIKGIEMERAVAHHAVSRSSFDPAMELIFVDQNQLGGPTAEALAPIVANEIALLLESGAEIEGRPAEPGDIAVLCRSNKQALAVTAALRASSVPVSLDGGASVLSTEIATDLGAVLEAALMPGDSALVRRALLTSLLGVSPRELSSMPDEIWSAWLTRFAGWNETWHCQGVVRFVEDLLRSTGVETKIARQPLAGRVLTDLLHIEELLLRGERERRRDPIALMQWFRRLKDDGAATGSIAAEDLQQRPDAGSGAVRVSTIHKSKGLEYPVIYCPFTSNDAALRDFDRVAVKFHGEDRNMKVDIGSEQKDKHKAISEDEALSEALRLLYVAVTRAKYRCTVFWGPAHNWKKSALAYLLHGRDELDGMNVERMMTDLDAFASASGGSVAWRTPHTRTAAKGQAGAPSHTLAAREQTRGFAHAPRIASFTSITGHDEETPGPRAAVDEADLAPSMFAELPGGVRTGLLLHSILEMVDFGDLGSGPTRHLIEAKLRDFGFESSLGDGLQSDLEGVGMTPLVQGSSSFCLADLPRDRQLRELEFTLHVNRPRLPELAGILSRHGSPAATPGYHERLAEVSSQSLQQFLRGYIDLMFEWDGRWYVADYKSNTLPTYTPQSINEAVQRTHYLLQAQLYSAAAHRYLRQRLRGYDPKTQWGGALFLFLRGMRGPDVASTSVFFDRQSAELLNEVDRWLGGVHEPL